MNSKKKLVVALSTLCCVLVAAVVAVVAVLAASSQTINSNITVTYSADQIAGSATATYMLEADEDWSTLNAVTFTGGDEDKAPNFDKEITLTSTKRYVVFKYVFSNTGDKAYTAKVLYSDDYKAADDEAGTEATGTQDTNVTLTYSTSQLTETGEGEELNSVYDNAKTATVLDNDGASVSVPAGGSAELYIYVAVADVAKNASFSGLFAWTLA